MSRFQHYALQVGTGIRFCRSIDMVSADTRYKTAVLVFVTEFVRAFRYSLAVTRCAEGQRASAAAALISHMVYQVIRKFKPPKRRGMVIPFNPAFTMASRGSAWCRWHIPHWVAQYQGRPSVSTPPRHWER